MGKAAEAELIVGAGTHLDTHTAALCDARGRTLSQLQVAATNAGYARLLQPTPRPPPLPHPQPP